MATSPKCLLGKNISERRRTNILYCIRAGVKLGWRGEAWLKKYRTQGSNRKKNPIGEKNIVTYIMFIYIYFFFANKKVLLIHLSCTECPRSGVTARATIFNFQISRGF